MPRRVTSRSPRDRRSPGSLRAARSARVRSTSSSRLVASAVHGSAAAPAEPAAIDSPGSVFENASPISAAAVSIADRRAASWSDSTETIAAASRGIAFRLLPPSKETSRNGVDACAPRSARPSTFSAFERPSAIPVPECPPCPPLTATSSATAPASEAARGASIRIHVSVLPAQPTVSTPSSSLSRLMMVEPVRRDPSRAFAPSRPTSSATVISSSSGPCGSDSSSTSAIMAAIATPSSAPSVVPSAVSHSPSRRSAIRPSAGSFGLEGSRSHTMSRWPWRMRVGALSRPGVAGTRTTRLRPESCCSSNPCSSAQARTCSITGSSCRDGRAIFVSVSKCRQNDAGSSPTSTDVSAGGLAMTRGYATVRAEATATRCLPG